MSTLRTANLFFETLKPWELKRNPDTQKELDVVLHVTLETLKVTGILLQPMVPNLSKILLDKINVGREERNFSDAKRLSWSREDFGDNDVPLEDKKVVLFKRILLENEKSLKSG
ncbi:hypothetical protein JTB14_033250 [Gonioctena quinquepunctata]|nr:hypothetical protein JTB14_033250 [Gonioctena quinquepunctata]